MMSRILLLTCFLVLRVAIIHAQDWSKLYQKADSLLQKRAYKEAMPLYEQALNLVKDSVEVRRQSLLRMRNGLGRCYVSLREKAYTQAFLAETDSLILLYAPGTLIQAEALQYAGIFYMLKGSEAEYPKSVSLIRQAIDLKEKNGQKLTEDYGQSLFVLIQACEKQGDDRQTEQALRQHLAWNEATYGPKDRRYISAWIGLANFYKQTTRYPQAEAAYLRVAELRRAVFGEMSVENMLSLRLLGSHYQAVDDQQRAIRHYRQALDMIAPLNLTNSKEHLNTLTSLGLVYKKYDYIAEAEQCFVQAIDVARKLEGEKSELYGLALQNIGFFYDGIANYAEAKRYYEQVAALRAEVSGEDTPDYAAILNNLGNLLRQTGEWDKAAALHRQGMAIREKAFGKGDVLTSLSYNNLGDVLCEQGRWAEAETYLRKALDIRLKKLGENHVYTAYTRHSLGQLYVRTQRYAEAEESYRAAVRTRRALLGENHPDYFLSLSQLLQLYQVLHRQDEALNGYDSILYEINRRIERDFSSLSEKEKTAYYQYKIRPFFQQFNALAINRPEMAGKLYDLQLQTKGLLLQSTQKLKSRITQSPDSSLQRQYRQWTDLKILLAKYYQMSAQDLVEAGIPIDSLEQAANKIEKDLAMKSAVFATLQGGQEARWQDIRRRLKSREAAIEIIRVNRFGVRQVLKDTAITPQRQYPVYGLTDTVVYAVLIITKSSKVPELLLIENGNDLENRYFRYYRNMISTQSEDEESYRQYWQPIQERLGKVKKVYVSPDGVYHQLNLNTLFDPVRRKFLIEALDIRQVTNSSEILSANTLTAKPAAGSRAMLYGRPAYHIPTATATADGPQTDNYDLRDLRDLRGDLSDLAGTQTEILLIDSLLSMSKWQSQKHLQADATEEQVKSVQNPYILHIATHGFFIPDQARYNPMLNSGILMAGVTNYFRAAQKPATEDGVLTAFEAQDLHLDQTELVVLSACETGLGEVQNGEGVYGLQRALKVAGARTVMMSLWKVDDEATQKLMTRFYAEMVRTGRKREAFRRAQQWLRGEYPSPFYWGAFVMVGE